MNTKIKQHINWYTNDEGLDYSIVDVIEDHINCNYDSHQSIKVLCDIIARMEQKLESIIENDLIVPSSTK